MWKQKHEPRHTHKSENVKAKVEVEAQVYDTYLTKNTKNKKKNINKKKKEQNELKKEKIRN
jgi:hypothetical protein